jgi:tRNA threonylcarbamoyladenosine biosynthesis protein TsaB
MLALGIDTALKSCSAAILDDRAVLAAERLPLEKGHAEHLAPMVARVLASAGVAVKDLDRVGVIVGPGGFAGVRVGLAFARGLGLGTKLKVVGVTSLAALAAAVREAKLIAAVIDARRDQVYAALYESGVVREAPFVASPTEALSRLSAVARGERVALVGDGVGLLGTPPPHFFAAGAAAEIDPAIVARIALEAPAPVAPPAPLYLRPPDAKPGAPSPFAGIFEEQP